MEHGKTASGYAFARTQEILLKERDSRVSLAGQRPPEDIDFGAAKRFNHAR
jgi:hypothetical protein